MVGYEIPRGCLLQHLNALGVAAHLTRWEIDRDGPWRNPGATVARGALRIAAKQSESPGVEHWMTLPLHILALFPVLMLYLLLLAVSVILLAVKNLLLAINVFVVETFAVVAFLAVFIPE